MKKRNTIMLIGCIVGLLGLVLFLMFDYGQKIERRGIRREAIEAGVAEFVVTNPTSGATEFRWIPPVQAPTIEPLHKIKAIEPERIER